MRKLAVAAALVLLAVPSAGARSVSNRSSVLTAVADIGTVYWRSSCVVGKPQRWSLGVRLFDTATTKVTLRVGDHVTHRIMQPNGRVWFGLTTGARQHLAFVQLTEPGTLRGAVSVDFGGQSANHCPSYMPPRVTTQLYPRS